MLSWVKQTGVTMYLNLPEDEVERFYAEMCRVVGDAVFILAESNLEINRMVISDILRTALSNKSERSDEMIRCMESAIKLLDY